ncbi:MAG: IS21 family transposase, partial [Pyrinomonadaceae bacterium]|nr:IS21 family transposase [Pyrinomonadaceae bacterium]
MSRTEPTLELAAAQAGMDPKTARKYLADDRPPSEMKPDRTWRTRPDPFAAAWPKIKEQLELNPGLEAKTIFEALQQQYPGEFATGQLRTLQRRIRQWRAMEGPGREVFFRQEHVPGRLAQSDFTHMTELGVTIDGQTFPHLVFHFVLPYSGWEWVSLCYSESFESLSEGLQEALWALSGVPLEHQTDRMSTAVNNTSEQREFTSRYESLLRHYRMTGRKIQTGKANENGSVEQRHHRFKRAVERTLIMRQSRDFQTIAQYSEFLKLLVARLNAGRRERVRVEMEYLKALPDRRTDSARRMTVRVDSGSMIYVDRNAYS